MGVKRDKVVLVTDGVHVSSVTVEDGVSLFVVGKTPSVMDAEISMSEMKETGSKPVGEDLTSSRPFLEISMALF